MARVQVQHDTLLFNIFYCHHHCKHHTGVHLKHSREKQTNKKRISGSNHKPRTYVHSVINSQEGAILMRDKYVLDHHLK